MILIADSGSTKTAWGLWDGGRLVGSVKTAGINPYYQEEADIATTIGGELVPALGGVMVDRVYFYGAGCAFEEKNRQVARAINRFIPAPVEVASDLMAAARALCGDRPGIACILGTGSNSCLYDGRLIVEQVSPLGFILGDEGSGAVLGKLFVGDCLKRQLPEALAREFMERYELTPALLLDRVYKRPFPNRFLASLSPFIHEHLSEPSVYRMVYESFRSFFIRNVRMYTGYQAYEAGFVGSVAYHYQEVLRAAASSVGVGVGAIMREPMDALARYHQ